MYQVIKTNICECSECLRLFALQGTEALEETWQCPACKEVNNQLDTLLETTYTSL